jgi:hypothetical protein
MTGGKNLKTLMKCMSIILLMALAFTACLAQDDVARPEFGQPTFYLSELPELEPFEIPPEITSRYGGIAFNDRLEPADDYGKLYPFVGRLFGNEMWTSIRYGLVDAYGRIVVDPVYENAYYLDADATYLFLSYPQDRVDPESVDIWEIVDQPRKFTIARADGGWVKDDFFGNWATLSEDRIIVMKSVDMMPAGYALYDLEGQFLSEGNGYINEFSEGLGIVSSTEFSPDGRTLQRAWYIDRNGNTVIPGPFIDARSFTDGKAIVSIGEDWDNALYGVIDTKGNFLVEPSGEKEYLRYSIFGQEYYVFHEARNPASDDSLYGIIDKNDDIIVPAEYRFIHLPLDSLLALAGDYESGEVYLISLPDGGRQRLTDGNIPNIYTMGNDWIAVNNMAPRTGVDEGGTLILIKGDKEYQFDYEPEQSVSALWIEEDLIALNYYDFSGQTVQNLSRTDIFDGSSGRIIKSLNGWMYGYSIGDMRLFNHPEAQRTRVLDRNFEPMFTNETVDFRWFYQLTEGTYQATTTFSSGLLRENGEWLIRVNLSSID